MVSPSSGLPQKPLLRPVLLTHIIMTRKVLKKEKTTFF